MKNDEQQSCIGVSDDMSMYVCRDNSLSSRRQMNWRAATRGGFIYHTVDAPFSSVFSLQRTKALSRCDGLTAKYASGILRLEEMGI